MNNQLMSPDVDIQYLKGVGPKLGALFKRKGINNLLQLIEFYPRAYEDRRAVRNIASLQENEIVSLRAQVVGVRSFAMGRSVRKIYEITLRDESGFITCKYFRVPYKGYFERFTSNKVVQVIGKVTLYRGRKEFHHPDIKDYNPHEENQDELIPLYTEIEGLSSSKIQKLIQTALHLVDKTYFNEKLPSWVTQKYNLPGLFNSFLKIHHPDAENAFEYINFKSKSHKRIIFEEFFWLELFLASRRAGLKQEDAFAIESPGNLVKQLLDSLPFKLTNAQVNSFDDIMSDLQKPHPMHRLIQGDVGSGKTMVAFMSVAYAIEGGFQCSLMVPTEILAEQHFRNAQKVLSPMGIQVALLTGKMKASEKKEVIKKLQSGEIHFCIGTHALIEDDVLFMNLGLVVIDEQHRFGVHQRAMLKHKGQSPHFLVMTATPIPRTLAMTVYGDLDVSIIDEMPAGRTPITTRVVYESKRDQVMDFTLEQIGKGRQAYIVYPLVEESEKIDLKDAISQFEMLKVKFPQVRWGLLHGKMKADEKEQIMRSFRAHELDVLVSTTVIEVGVDVSNATLMIVEHAERFGLSQLHQLRGRVGRGSHKSYCVLMLGNAVSAEGKERTGILERTNDGFKVAEADLEMRGPGEFLGTRQSGLAGFKMANLVRDVMILQEARQAAFEIIKKDPELKFMEHRKLKDELTKSKGPISLAGIG